MGDSVNRDENGHDDKGRFIEGNKGGGRPAVARDFRERCRTFMADEGWATLLAIAGCGDDKDRYRALELIAAYAYGKPKQGLEVTGEDGGPIRGVVILPEVLIAKAEEVVKRE